MKLRTHIALTLVVAAVAVPAAYSNTANQPTKAGTPDVVARYLSNQAQPAATDAEDVVARYLNNEAQPAATDAEDVVARYLNNQAPVLAGQHSANGGGFDWVDAGMGAAGTLGTVLVLIVGSFLVLRRRRGLAT